MNGYLAIPTRADAQYIAIEAAKGAVTGFAFGGGTLPVAAAFGLAKTLSCVHGPSFDKLQTYFELQKQTLAAHAVSVLSSQGPMLVAATLLKSLGYNQASFSRLTLASVIGAFGVSVMARKIFFEAEKDSTEKKAARIGFFVSQAFSAAQLVGSNCLLFPLTVFVDRFARADNLEDKTKKKDGSLVALGKRVCTNLLPFTAIAGALAAIKFGGMKAHNALYSFLEKNRAAGTVGMTDEEIGNVMATIAKKTVIQLVAGVVLAAIVLTLRKARL